MRSPIFVILLLLVCLCPNWLFGEAAQLRLAGPGLELPPAWEQIYDPPEVLIRVRVEPDSSLALLEILDGKQELRSLVSEQLSKFSFSIPSDSLISGNVMTVVMPLIQADNKGLVNKSGPDLPTIEAWIGNRSALAGDSELSPTTLSLIRHTQFTPYQAGYYQYSLSSDATDQFLHGYPLLDSYFGSSFYTGMLGNVYDRRASLTGDDFLTSDLPAGITLSYLQTGLGDYEHRYARGFIGKKDLFGRPGLRLSLDFLLSNGYWMESNSSGSAVKGSLSVPLGRTTLDLEIADFADRASMYQLQPEYWLTTAYTAEQRYRLYYLEWKNPIIDLSLLSTNETLKSQVFATVLRNNALRLRASRELRISSVRIVAQYERKISDRSDLPTNSDFTDRIGLLMDYSGKPVQAETGVQLLDFQRTEAWIDGTIPLGSLKLSPYAKLYINDDSPETWVPDILLGSGSLLSKQLVQKADWGLQTAYSGIKSLNISLAGGQRQVLAPDSFISPAAKSAVEVNLPYLSASMEFTPRWDNWSLRLAAAATRQFADPVLLVEPDFRYQSSISLCRDLGYNNALKAGFDGLGHSSFSTGNSTIYPIDPSFIGDLWLAVQISTRFEFKVAWKNFTNNAVYGVYPLPSSLHTSLRWYFLN